MAEAAVTSRHANFLFEIAFWNFLVAVKGNECAKTYGHGVSAESEGLGGVGAAADATGGDETDLSV